MSPPADEPCSSVSDLLRLIFKASIRLAARPEGGAEAAPVKRWHIVRAAFSRAEKSAAHSSLT
jgi:hypothetical protein